MTEIMDELKKAIVEGDEDLALEKLEECLNAGEKPAELLEKAVVAGINEAGRLWQENEYFLPDVILSAEAFKAVMAEMGPKLAGADVKSHGTVLIGTVEGDMHDLGKSIVIAMLSSAGYQVHDLGVDVPANTFIEKTKELKPDILGLGAYMSTTMEFMGDIIHRLVDEGIRDQVKVLIGGVPTSAEFAAEIKADAWGKDALDAVEKANQLLG